MWQDLIWQPSDQAGDALAWAGSQAAHALIVGGLIAAVLMALRWPLWLGAAGYALWEAWHWLIGGDALDSLTDWAFVVAGMALTVFAWRGRRRSIRIAFAGLILAAAIGMWLRV